MIIGLVHKGRHGLAAGSGVSKIKLNQRNKRIEITGVEIESELAFAYFDKIPEDERDATFKRAFHIGVLALNQDRLASFLAKTTNELGTELETLKIMFDMETELFSRSAVKGAAAELRIHEYLSELVSSKGLKDEIDLTGSAAGKIAKNKTGDIVCTLDCKDDRRIAIECKFDKGIPMGEAGKRDWYGKNLDTAVGQLLESKANRDAHQAIIVLDRSSINPAIQKAIGNVGFISGVGFVVVVDSLRDDFENLGAAYLIARDLAVAGQTVDIDSDLLLVIIDKLLNDIKQIADIRGLVESSIATSNEILNRLEKGMLSIEFSRSYLSKFLADRTLSNLDLLEFYAGGDVKQKYASIEAEINALGGR